MVLQHLKAVFLIHALLSIQGQEQGSLAPAETIKFLPVETIEVLDEQPKVLVVEEKKGNKKDRRPQKREDYSSYSEDDWSSFQNHEPIAPLISSKPQPQHQPATPASTATVISASPKQSTNSNSGVKTIISDQYVTIYPTVGAPRLKGEAFNQFVHPMSLAALSIIVILAVVV